MHLSHSQPATQLSINSFIGVIKSINFKNGHGTIDTVSELPHKREGDSDLIHFVLDIPAIYQHLSTGKKAIFHGDIVRSKNRATIQVGSAALMY